MNYLMNYQKNSAERLPDVKLQIWNFWLRILLGVFGRGSSPFIASELAGGTQFSTPKLKNEFE